ncbi:hypothetical protein CSCA_4910 [Clostridium scatologenes]|uniref:Uncharacterized protein n=1 Tax=Clostridium scatologenes TaxID=1548 RepID=A0A0E3JS15_CLOSL|nr:hypothetical protein CSCA_4910 [Clostridium scatologenes]
MGTQKTHWDIKGTSKGENYKLSFGSYKNNFISKGRRIKYDLFNRS